MAYDYSTIVISGLVDDRPLAENFRILDPTGVEADNYTILGDITISGTGDSKAQLYLKDSTHYIELDGTNQLNISDPVTVLDDFTADNIFAKEKMYVNSDYAGGFGTARVYFNGTTQWLDFTTTNGYFEFSENVRSKGTTLSVGDGFGNDMYLNFDITAWDFPGQRNPRGFRYQFSTGTIQVSHNGTDWLTVGTASFSGSYLEVLQIGNRAGDQEVYTGKVYSQVNIGDNYIKLDAGTNPSDNEIEFSVSGYDAKHIYFDGATPKFRVDTALHLTDILGTTRYDFKCQDIYCGIGTGSTYDGTIYFGADIENVKIVGETTIGAGTDTLDLYADTITLNGNVPITGNVTIDGNSLSLNDDYASGDEDVTISLNNGAETLKLDYGLTAFMASAPNFYIGTYAKEDVTLKWYSNNSPVPRIWVANTTGKLWIEDANGIAELNTGALVSGLQQDLDSVTTIGNTTTNDIIVNNTYLDGALYINYQGTTADGIINFHDAGAADDEWIKFDGADDWFETSNDLFVGGVLRIASNNIYLKQNGPDGNQYMYFYDGGSTIGESLSWQDVFDYFQFTNSLNVQGAVTATSADIAGLVQCNSFRIDQAPVSEAVTPTHSVTINVNGTDYKFAVEAA